MPKTSSGRNQALHEIESPCAASEIRNNEYAHDAENSRPNSVEQLHSGQINRITAQRVEDAPNGQRREPDQKDGATSPFWREPPRHQRDRHHH